MTTCTATPRSPTKAGRDQGLKYNFQGGGTVQVSGPPVRSRAHFQIINDILNDMNDYMLFLLQFCKNIQHYEFMIVKM